MKLQERIPLNELYKPGGEREFSADLAEHLDALKVGQFEDAETEAYVGARKADIVATGGDGTLVIECQLGKADWNHWGRLEAYARLKKADIAVLVAEEFEDLMIVTCRRCDEDSSIDWYLIEAHANSHGELSFHHAAGPSIEIQMEEKMASGEESKFWAPIRRGEYGALFAGKPVPRKQGSIGKQTRNISVYLYIRNKLCYVMLYFGGKSSSEDKIARRDTFLELLSDQEGEFELSDPNAIEVYAKLPVLDKGRNDEEDWDEIRAALVKKGEELYNIIENSEA